MLSLNQSTIMSALTSILMLVGMYLVASGHLTSDQWTAQSKTIVDGVGALVTVAIGIWKLFPHSDTKIVSGAGAILAAKQAGSVVIAPTAEPKLQALAADPNVKGVNPT